MRRRDWIVQVLQSSLAVGLGANLLAGATDEHWRPQFLTPAQNETLIAVAECIVPGSREAHCNRVIDLLLSIESEKTQREMMDALATFDANGAFSRLDSDRQAALLTSVSQDNSPHFQTVKEWVADAYWSSEKGLRELGWTGRMAWENSAGCANAPGQP